MSVFSGDREIKILITAVIITIINIGALAFQTFSPLVKNVNGYSGNSNTIYIINELTARKYNISIEDMERVEDVGIFNIAVDPLGEEITEEDNNTPAVHEHLPEITPINYISLIDGDNIINIDRDELDSDLPASQYGLLAEYLPTMIEVSVDMDVSVVAMISQFKLESGFGKKVPRNSDGSPSFNFFGLTASKRYVDNGGKYTTVTTTEFINGEKRKVTRKFRTYTNAEEAFRDYANVIKTYYDGGYDLNMFKKYASDPEYTNKLNSMQIKTRELLNKIHKKI